MLTVKLQHLKFHAFHGIYKGETKIGSDFEVDLSVTYNDKKLKLDRLDNILNYEELYDIVKKRMLVASPLLEEVAESVIGKIKHEYSFVKEISFSIYKLQAPMGEFQGKVGITLHKKFED